MLGTFIEYTSMPYTEAICYGVHEMGMGEREGILVESPYIISTLLGIIKAFLHLGLTITLRSRCLYDHYFTDVKSELQRGEMTSPRSLSYEKEELVF